MYWTTPTLVEICIGLEINGYLPAEFWSGRCWNNPPACEPAGYIIKVLRSPPPPWESPRSYFSSCFCFS